MDRLCLLVLVTIALGFAGAATATDTPTIETPQEGAALGPNYDISGSMPYRALLVVMTDCILADTGEVVASVPGIRHWVEANDAFHFRCASPRIVIGDTDARLNYRTRCFEAKESGEAGPEAVVNCNSVP